MYTPRPFQVDDIPTLLAFMRDHPFATVITPTSGVPAVTHIPVLGVCDGDNIRIRAHMARANEHSALLDGDVRTLIAFQGPHAYVSPILCDPGAGPTWDYIAVHASGPVRTLDGEDAHEFVHELIAGFDPDFRAVWDDADEALRTRMVAGIVPFEMDVTRLEGNFKLGQNRSSEDRADRGASDRVDGHEHRGPRSRHGRSREVARASSERAPTLWVGQDMLHRTRPIYRQSANQDGVAARMRSGRAGLRLGQTASRTGRRQLPLRCLPFHGRCACAV